MAKKQPIIRSNTVKKKIEKKPVSEEYKQYQTYIKSKDFKELRSKVLERDGYTCQFCNRTIEEIEGTKLTLQVHHKTYENVGKCNEEEMEDCITLCSVCHKNCHQAPSNRHRFIDKHHISKNLEERNN